MPRSLLQLSVGSVVVVVGLCWLMLGLQTRDVGSVSGDNTNVQIYCASGLVPAVEKVVAAYQAQTGKSVQIVRTGGSGELVGQLSAEGATSVERGADLIISADASLLEVAKTNGLVREILPVARQTPVIAVRADSGLRIGSLEELLADRTLRFGIASPQAAIGAVVRSIAQDRNLLTQLELSMKTESENVMTLAQALLTGNLDAAIIWDTTVEQINQQHEARRLMTAAVLGNDKQNSSEIAVGVVARSANATESLRFAQFLNASDGGQPIMRAAGFKPVDGDLW